MARNRLKITAHGKGGKMKDPFDCTLARELNRQYGGPWYVGNGREAVRAEGPFLSTRVKLGQDGRSVIRTTDTAGPRAVREKEITVTGPQLAPQTADARQAAREQAAEERAREAGRKVRRPAAQPRAVEGRPAPQRSAPAPAPARAPAPAAGRPVPPQPAARQPEPVRARRR